jgi:hypothetical protein
MNFSSPACVLHGLLTSSPLFERSKNTFVRNISYELPHYPIIATLLLLPVPHRSKYSQHPAHRHNPCTRSDSVRLIQQC